MDRKIKVGIVNYLNTAPLLYGINHSGIIEQIQLIQDYPSKVATQLLKNEIDVGLVPVAILPELKEYHIVTDYCIGTNDAVASVCLFSKVPIHEVKTVLLDYQSRTSVELTRILLKEFWKISPEFIYPTEDYQTNIKGSTAGLVIGDRAFIQRKVSPYIYDLGEAWKQHTGLPFVFAVWVSKQQLSEAFIDSFNKANGFGLQEIDKVIAETPYPIFDLHAYYTRNISYILDDQKKEGLQLFLDKLD